MELFHRHIDSNIGLQALAWKAGLLLVSLLWFTAGCGVKAPPVPPDIKPPMVAVLSHTLEEGGRLALTWRLAAGSPPAQHYTIYQSRTPLSDEPCEGCPLVFKRLMTISSDGNREVVKSLTIEQGYRNGFKITATDNHGLEGPDSNTIQFNY